MCWCVNFGIVNVLVADNNTLLTPLRRLRVFTLGYYLPALKALLCLIAKLDNLR